MNTATRLRQAGRSWSEIRNMTGLTVAEAKAEVAADKQEIRNELAHSHRNEEARGLHDECYALVDLRRCGHERKDHVDGECIGCREYVVERSAKWGSAGEGVCTEFKEKQRWSSTYSPYPNDVNLNLRRHGGKVQGTWGGRLRGGYLGVWVHADMPSVPAKRVLARLRRNENKQT